MLLRHIPLKKPRSNILDTMKNKLWMLKITTTTNFDRLSIVIIMFGFKRVKHSRKIVYYNISCVHYK